MLIIKQYFTPLFKKNNIHLNCTKYVVTVKNIYTYLLQKNNFYIYKKLVKGGIEILQIILFRYRLDLDIDHIIYNLFL